MSDALEHLSSGATQAKTRYVASATPENKEWVDWFDWELGELAIAEGREAEGIGMMKTAFEDLQSLGFASWGPSFKKLHDAMYKRLEEMRD